MYLACFENCRGCHAFSSDGITEAVVQMCSVKKVFFKILRNLQETTCARDSSLIKLQASGLQLYKKETLAQVFSCEFCESFQNIFFYRTPLVAASGMSITLNSFMLLVFFYTPRKNNKSSGFLIVLGSIEIGQCHEISSREI